MNEYDYGPKFPAGEIVLVEEIGWSVILSVKWERDQWLYQVQTEEEKEYEVKECLILL